MASAEEVSGNPLVANLDAHTDADAVKVDGDAPEVCKFFLRGRCHFGDRCRLSHSAPESSDCKPEETEERSSKNRRARKKSGKTEKSKDGERQEPPEPEKKPRMRTADEVISRILWDSSVNPEDFVVGHLDRFLGVLERPFSDFSWDTQVCDCDYSEELTIPRHRIQYFNYKGQRMWDKDSRTDRVFGSTGQTVLPPFDREDQAQDTRQGHYESQALKNEPENPCDSKDTADSELNGSKDEDSRDATLASETEALSVSPKDEQIAPEKEWKNGWDDEKNEENEETQPVQSVPPEPLPGRTPRRPTHFICFRVDTPAALLAFQRVQRKILTHIPQSEKFWVNPPSLHVTLCLLVLQSPAEVQAAAELLRSIVKSRYKPPISISFPPKLKHFNGKVLYMPPQPVQDVQSLNTPLQEAFREKGWLHRHSKCPSYHLTLAKVEGEEPERMFEDVGAIKLAKDINFGKLEVDKLYLCVKGGSKTESGFYQTVCAIQMPTV